MTGNLIRGLVITLVNLSSLSKSDISLLDYCSKGERNIGEISKKLNLCRRNIERKQNKLINMDYIKREKRGRYVYLTTTDIFNKLIKKLLDDAYPKKIVRRKTTVRKIGRG